MTITIIRNTSSTDEWGNPLPPVPTALYTGAIKEIDLQSFYPEKLEFKEDGSLKYKLKKLFLKSFPILRSTMKYRLIMKRIPCL